MIVDLPSELDEFTPRRDEASPAAEVFVLAASELYDSYTLERFKTRQDAIDWMNRESRDGDDYTFTVIEGAELKLLLVPHVVQRLAFAEA